MSFALAMGRSSDEPAAPADASADAQTDAALQLSREGRQLEFEQLRQAVAQQLTTRLAAAGVDLSESAVLAFDAQGRLLEVGNHWDRAVIERTLEAEPHLRAQVAQLWDAAGALWESGPSGAGPASVDTLRLVVTAQDALVQVV